MHELYFNKKKITMKLPLTPVRIDAIDNVQLYSQKPVLHRHLKLQPLHTLLCAPVSWVYKRRGSNWPGPSGPGRGDASGGNPVGSRPMGVGVWVHAPACVVLPMSTRPHEKQTDEEPWVYVSTPWTWASGGQHQRERGICELVTHGRISTGKGNPHTSRGTSLQPSPPGPTLF